MCAPWRPMAEAPKDRHILVPPDEPGGRPRVVIWTEIRFRGPPGEPRDGELLHEFWTETQSDGYEARVKPAAWMPIPEWEG